MSPTASTNQRHAERLLAEAAQAAHRRHCLVVAIAALNSTTTVAAARRSLAEYDTGRAEVLAGAVAILDSLQAEPG